MGLISGTPADWSQRGEREGIAGKLVNAISPRRPRGSLRRHAANGVRSVRPLEPSSWGSCRAAEQPAEILHRADPTLAADLQTLEHRSQLCRNRTALVTANLPTGPIQKLQVRRQVDRQASAIRRSANRQRVGFNSMRRSHLQRTQKRPACARRSSLRVLSQLLRHSLLLQRGSGNRLSHRGWLSRLNAFVG